MTDKIHQSESPPAATGGQDDASSVRELAQREDKGLPVLAPDERAIATQVKAFFAECDVEGDLRASAFIKSGGKDVPFYERALHCERLVHGHHNAPISDDPASIDAAIKLLTLIARDVAKAPQPAVICPPLVLLKPGEKAALENIIYAPAFFLDADNAPAKTLREAEDRLGPATYIVASGSDWVDPLTGEIEAKRHAYWLFKQAARTPTEIARVIDLFKAAKRMFAGADKSITPVHGMRLWGTANRKSLYVPRSCLLIEERPFERLDIAVAETALLGKAAPRSKKPAPVPFVAPQTVFDLAATAHGDTSDAALIGGLLRGETYHQPLVALAYRSIARGLTIEETTAYLQTLMSAVPESLRDGGEPGRWRARYGDIPRIVGSAPEAVARKRSDDAGGPDMTLLHPERSPAVALPADLLKPLQKGGTNALEAWVLAAAEAKGAPLDYVVVTTLAVVASVLSGVDVEVWPEFREPLIIWAALVGDPSSNKSPGMAPALEALEDLERDLRSAALAEYGRWLEDKKAAEKAGEEFDEPPPVIPRLTVSDVTVESLCEQIAKQGRGVAYALDELAALLGNFSRYSGGTDRPFWVKAHGGKQHPILRLSREASDVPRAAVSVVGAIQPAKLYELLLRTADDGLTSRFVFAYPDPAPVKRPTKWPDRTLMKGALEKLYEIGSGLTLRFDDEAKDVIDSVRLWVRQEEVKSEGLIKGTIGKASGLVVRVAGVLTLLDWAISGGPVPTTVGKLATERARVFVQDYVVPMARRVIGETASPGETRGARRLARLIVEGVPQRETINIREIQKRERTHLQTSAEIEAAIDVLVQGRWLTLESGKPGPKGGRPLHVWRVNPDVFRRAAGVSSGYAGFAGPGVGGEQ
jgi:hypothetical protein